MRKGEGEGKEKQVITQRSSQFAGNGTGQDLLKTKVGSGGQGTLNCENGRGEGI